MMSNDCPPESQAFVFIGQRVYVFAILDVNLRGLLPDIPVDCEAPAVSRP